MAYKNKENSNSNFILVLNCLAVIVLFVSSGFISSVNALPFNTDMMSTQPTDGRIMRPKPDGSIQIGAGERYVGTREEAASLQNPNPKTKLSLLRGERLFNVNCSPCHGKYIEGKYIAGAVSKLIPGPDLSHELYKPKPDSHFFQFIHFGGMAIMPAYGSKFSIPEHWDIVNYIRSVQERAK